MIYTKSDRALSFVAAKVYKNKRYTNGDFGQLVKIAFEL